MSIATEISRLQTAKADIKTAIEAKGVTVPGNATLDTYDTYVSQIQTGGGGGTNYLEQYANKSLSGVISSTQIGTNIGSNMPVHFLEEQPITSVDLTGTGATTINQYFCYKCPNLTSVTIPNTITEIGTNLCAYSTISSVTIPSTVTTLGQYCCAYCPNITQFICNATISAINNYTCIDAGSLSLVDLGESISSVGNGFCTANTANANLLEVVLRKKNGIVSLPRAISDTYAIAPFYHRKNIKVYVPNARIPNYKADANWKAGVSLGYVTFVALEGSQYE